ncbi:hypothetical protein [Weissella confusa]|uniref:hypothetical protein n=1 Tax=Weissella confusa TaxID=1583 RepID=UPI00107F6B64|nr:hypothetical protein [Weissella confusa]
MTKYRNWLVYAILVVMPAFVVMSYFRFGILATSGNDMVFHLSRLQSLLTEMQSGTVPGWTDWAGQGNMGFAVNMTYPWLTLLLIAIPQMLFGSVTGYAVGMYIINLVTTIGMYKLVRTLNSTRIAALFSSMIYLYSTYHLIELYQRQSVGEVLGYAMLPLAAIGIVQIWQHKKTGIIWLASGVALTINSHLLSTVVVVALAAIAEAIHQVWVKFDLKTLILEALAAVLSFLLSMLPLLTLGMIHMKNHIIPSDYWGSMFELAVHPRIAWQTMVSGSLWQANRTTDWNPGLVVVIFVVIALVYSVVNFKKINKTQIMSFIGIVVFGFLSSTWAPWGLLTKLGLGVFQFPGRLLLPAVFFAAIFVGSSLTVAPVKKTTNTILAGLFVIALGLVSLQTYTSVGAYVKQATASTAIFQYTDQNYEHELMNLAPSFAYSAIVNSNATVDEGRNRMYQTLNDAKAMGYHVTQVSGDGIRAQISVNEKKLVTLPVFKYDGVKYNVMLNGERIAPKTNDAGFMQLKLKQGQNDIQIKTPVPVWYTAMLGFELLLWAAITVFTVVIFIRSLGMSNKSKVEREYD